jgi:ankyrin repeat protein
MNIFEAALNGNVDRIRELLASGVDINSKNAVGSTALYGAARRSNDTSSLETVKFLIDNGVNVNAKNNYTALMAASENSNTISSLDTVKLLLDAGADVNAKSDKGVSVLGFAAKNVGGKSSIETVKLLLDRGADVNAKTNMGASILVLTVYNDNASLKTVKLLLDKGADVNSKTNLGETALDFAIANSENSLELVKLLLERDANVFENKDIMNQCPNAACQHLIADYVWKKLYQRDIDTARRYANQYNFPKDVWEIILLNNRQQLLCANLSTDKNKELLELFAIELNIPINPEMTKAQLCGAISRQLVYGKLYHNTESEMKRVKKELINLAKKFGIDTNRSVQEIMVDLGRVLM